MNTQPFNAPLLRPISLPNETYPFNLHSTLALNTPLTIDFDSPTLSFPALSIGELSRPATYPPTSSLRIVHPALDGSIMVGASNLSTGVTVGDVLSAIHRTLSLPLNTASIPSIRRADVLSYYQAYLRYNVSNRTLRRIHLLEGSCFFGGLIMDVAESNRILGRIDDMQALTWIMVTTEGASQFAYSFMTPASHIQSLPKAGDEDAIIPRRRVHFGHGAQPTTYGDASFW